MISNQRTPFMDSSSEKKRAFNLDRQQPTHGFIGICYVKSTFSDWCHYFHYITTCIPPKTGKENKNL